MPSLVPAFEYDIFISYRHNDNRSGWVTEFVSALKEELAATIKEPVSIYFDRNPHDGLLETHSVDQSLEGKLKCLIFIPILSQTFCDPKSFAWQHEFCVFNKLAKEDQFGRDIKLHSGNVTSRILPIKIHDLDAEDKAAIESEIGGVLRAIEFIYKEPGVNRPLKSADDKHDNLNKTDYRNQVNKVANAIKETIHALKMPLTIPARASDKLSTGNHHPGTRFKRVLIVSLLATIIVASGYFLYAKLFASELEISIDKSIAVLPFVNVSNDPEQEYFSDGLTDELLNMLARVPGLKVTGRTSSFAFKEKREDLRTIGTKLGVRYLLEGSVRMSGKNLRINTQLIKADDGTQLWAEQFDRTAEDVFKVQSEISQAVISNLKINVLGLEASQLDDKNVELYKQLLQGYYFSRQPGPENLQKAIDKFQSILKVDSLYNKAWSGLAVAYFSLALNDFTPYHTGVELSRSHAKKALSINPQSAEGHGILAAIHRIYDFDWLAAQKEIELGLRYDPQNPGILAQSGNLKTVLGDYVSATTDLLKSVETNPLDAFNHRELALNYLIREMYIESEREFLLAYELAPDVYTMPWYVSHFYILRQHFDKAEEYLKRPGLDKCIACAGMQAVMLNKQGNIAGAKERLQWLETNHADYWAGAIAMTYAMLDEKETALQWLERAIKQHDPDITNAMLRIEFKKYAKDERFIKAMKSINLDPDA